MKPIYPLTREPVVKATASSLIRLMDYSRQNVKHPEDIERIMRKLNLEEGSILSLQKLARDPEEEGLGSEEPTVPGILPPADPGPGPPPLPSEGTSVEEVMEVTPEMIMGPAESRSGTEAKPEATEISPAAVINSISQVPGYMMYHLDRDPQSFQGLTARETLQILENISTRIKESEKAMEGGAEEDRITVEDLKGIMMSKGKTHVPAEGREEVRPSMLGGPPVRKKPSGKYSPEELERGMQEAQEIMREHQEREGIDTELKSFKPKSSDLGGFPMSLQLRRSHLAPDIIPSN